jgi:hypothetical protein
VSQQILASTTLRGLYASCEWDERSIRSLIIAKRLAPIVAGASDETRITNLTVIMRPIECFFFFFRFCFFVFFLFFCALLRLCGAIELVRFSICTRLHIGNCTYEL